MPKTPAPQYWLLKSEPATFSFEDLWRAPGRRTGWDGVRNYQARNFLRDSMRLGDLVLFYHSGAEPSGVAGVARVAGGPRADPTQFDPRSPHYDPDSSREAPAWVEVEIEAVAKLPELVPLERLRAEPALGEMLLLQRGQRLSVLPVTTREWETVLRLAGLDAEQVRGFKSLGAKGLSVTRRPRRSARSKAAKSRRAKRRRRGS